MHVYITAFHSTTFLPPSTKLGQGYVFTGVCDSVHRGSTWPGTPRDQVHPPGTRCTPRTRYNPGTRSTPRPGTPPRTRYTPQDQVHPPSDQLHPSGPDTPLRTRYTPLAQSMLGDTVNVRAERILLEWNLVLFKILPHWSILKSISLQWWMVIVSTLGNTWHLLQPYWCSSRSVWTHH